MTAIAQLLSSRCSYGADAEATANFQDKDKKKPLQRIASGAFSAFLPKNLDQLPI